MDVIRGDGTLLQEIDLAPGNVHQEVIQNIAVILDLIQKSCPMFRDGGLPGELIGRPMNVVESILVGSIYDHAFTGKMIPIVELEGVKDIE